MPYAVVPPPGRDRRRALAESRWGAFEAARPDAAAATALQRKLIGIVLDLTETLEQTVPPRLSLPPRYVTTKLRSGIPALIGEPLQVPVAALRPPLLDLARTLAATGQGGRQILAALDDGRLDAGALLTLAVRREQAAIRAVATRLGLGHELVWLVADLAAGPYVHTLRQSLFDAAPAATPLRTELDAWSHGYCPLCGSWPSFVEEVTGARWLRCSFCAAAWDAARRGCIYCGTSAPGFDVVTPDRSRPGRTVETCVACRGYAKVVDTTEPLPFPLLPLVDFETMDLDMLAMQKGCGRPAVKTFTKRS